MTTKANVISAKQMEKLINNPGRMTIQIQQEVKKPSTRNVTFYSADRDFDTLNTEEMLRLFGLFLRNVISRFDENKRLQEEAEARENDLRHCMELVDGLTEKERRMIYRRLTEALQTRRACKIENEILMPLYNYIHDRTLINKLAQLQGAVSSAKTLANNRAYSCRTAVLDDFRAEPSPQEKAAEDCVDHAG